jgi:hypothetical protein
MSLRSRIAGNALMIYTDLWISRCVAHVAHATSELCKHAARDSSCYRISNCISIYLFFVVQR